MWKCSGALLLGILCLQVSAKELINVDSYQALTSDKRSFRVGEPLVILVAESTVAESSAGTEVGKDVEISAASEVDARRHSVGFGFSGRDQGAGQTMRKGRAMTQISARIVESLPNEMLKIEGKKVLKINGENQTILIAGVVRADDVLKDNTVLSNRISDASIEIHGEGDVSKAQRKSIIYKVLRWLRLV